LLAEPEIGPNTSLDDRDASKREKQMSALVKKKLAIMNDKQWRIKVCGRSVEVREKVDKIVKIVLRTPTSWARRVSWHRAWRTQGCLLYLVALLHLPSFFRFDVLV